MTNTKRVTISVDTELAKELTKVLKKYNEDKTIYRQKVTQSSLFNEVASNFVNINK